MSLLDLLEFTVHVGVHPSFPELTCLSVQTQIRDEEQAAELGCGAWRMEVRVPLKTETRVAWSTWDVHMGGELIDYPPSARVIIPAELVGPVEVQGYVDDECFSASGRPANPATQLTARPRNDKFRSWVTPVSVRPHAPALRALAPLPKGARVVATLPNVGLVSVLLHEGSARHALTTDVRTVPLPQLDRALANLPGVATYDPPRYIGGTNGRLAIQASRRDGIDVQAPQTCSLYIVDLSNSTLQPNVIQVFDAVSPNEFEAMIAGFFDEAAERFIGYERRSNSWRAWSVPEGSAGATWRAPIPTAGARWEFIDDVIWFTGNQTTRCEVDAKPLSVPHCSGDSDVCAYHPESEVHVWAIHGEPTSLLTFDPHDGERQFDLPLSMEPSLAVLADGRVLISDDELYVLNPADQSCLSLGPATTVYNEHLVTGERDGHTWLYMPTAERFAVLIPDNETKKT